MSINFYQILKTYAEENPKKTALIDGDTTLSYGQLRERVEKFAGALISQPLTPDSTLGILCVNQKENLIALLGAMLTKVTVVPMNPLLNPEDLTFIVRDAGIDILLINGSFIKPQTSIFALSFKTVILTSPCLPELKPPNAKSFDEFLENAPPFKIEQERNNLMPDLLLYTSGTTARPKGVPLKQEQLAINIEAFLKHLSILSEDRCIVALPLFHSFGNIMVLAFLRVGGTMVFLPQFQPKAILAKIAEHKATILPLVPTIYTFLVELVEQGNYDISSLRLCISGGASLPEALLKKVESVLGVTVLEGYGLTETSPVISVNKFSDGSVPGSVGPTLSNLAIKIIDDSGETVPQGEIGEILVKGPTVMKAYWKRPEETKKAFTKDGWFRTGDMGHLDNKSRLYISAGRKKDLIIRAGENISPLVIENAIMNHPAIREVSVVGIPHPRLGEQVKVGIVLREGNSATVKDIKELCRKNLPAFMKPDVIRFYKNFPKTSTGKIIKSQLRDD